MEQLDDVQLAVETLLAEEPGTDGEFVLEVWPEDGGLVLLLDGLDQREGEDRPHGDRGLSEPARLSARCSLAPGLACG